MKTTIIATLLTCIIIIGCALAVPAKAEEYPYAAIVVNYDAVRELVTCSDFTGNLWQFKDQEPWEIGAIAALLMDDNDTEEITDDKVVGANYAGWLDLASMLNFFKNN